MSGMILGERQARIDCANHPEIKRCNKPDIKGYESIRDAFLGSLMLRMCYEYKHSTKEDLKQYTWMQDTIDKNRKLYKDCIEQTIHYLKKNKLLKKCDKIKDIELWEKTIEMSPYYEGVNVQLKSMLINYHFPSMAANMKNGAMYSHQSLTDTSEVVLYIMEYFYREKKLEEIK